MVLSAQTDGSESSEEKTFETFNPETPAEFPGGEKALMDFIAQELKYPIGTAVQGKVIVGFTVETDGCISNVHTLRGVGSALDDEAVRLVRSMPPWTPGKSFGKAVRVNMTLPIHILPR